MRSTLYGIAAMAMMFAFVSGGLAAMEQEDAREADHEALRQLLTEVTEAINAQDSDAIVACFAKDFVFTTVDQTVLKDRDSIQAYFDEMLRAKKSPLADYKIAPEADYRTTLLDESTGYCIGTSDDAYTLRKNKRTIHMECRWTATVVKLEGKWKIATVHAGVDVLDNPALEIRSMPWWRKIIAAVGLSKFPGEKAAARER